MGIKLKEFFIFLLFTNFIAVIMAGLFYLIDKIGGIADVSVFPFLIVLFNGIYILILIIFTFLRLFIKDNPKE